MGRIVTLGRAVDVP